MASATSWRWTRPCRRRPPFTSSTRAALRRPRASVLPARLLGLELFPSCSQLRGAQSRRVEALADDGRRGALRAACVQRRVGELAFDRRRVLLGLFDPVHDAIEL